MTTEETSEKGNYLEFEGYLNRSESADSTSNVVNWVASQCFGTAFLEDVALFQLNFTSHSLQLRNDARCS
jgi:hypothetical protein